MKTDHPKGKSGSLFLSPELWVGLLIVVVPIVIIYFLSSQEATGSGQSSGQRTLSFPQDRSMGRLNFYNSGLFNRGSSSVEAQGDIAVSANAYVTLQVSRKGLEDLSPLAKLDPDSVHSLNLRAGKASDEGLQYISHIQSIRKLNLEGEAITDVGVAHIAALKNLDTLDLIHSGIADEGLAMLAQLPLMQEMSLDESYNLTDDGLKVLADMTFLRHLSLDFNPQLTNELAPHIARISSLQDLFLSKTQLNDEGLALFHGLPYLRRISLVETQVTKTGLKNLRTRFPRINITQ